MSVNRASEPLEILNLLEIVTRKRGTTIVIEMAGAWDLAGVPAARRAITDAVRVRPERVVLDLSGLAFMDASGIRATLELAHRLAAQHIGLVIVPGSRAVQRVFEITGLNERLPFIDKQPASVRAARPRTAPVGAARFDGVSPPPNGAGRRRPQAADAEPSLVQPGQD